jgi:hypothetical protein
MPLTPDNARDPGKADEFEELLELKQNKWTKFEQRD